MSITSKTHKIDKVLQNVTLVTMDSDSDYKILQQQDILILDGKILAIQDTLPATNYSCNLENLEGKLVTPGLIDCHTHLVFGGNRASEWEQRLNGIPYETIAKQGGGINTSVMCTRKDSAEQLFADAVPRLKALMDEGVTTIEIKSGYGLDLESERKQLAVAKKLGENFPIEVVGTLLSAHTTPVEYKENPDAYIDLICDTIIPTLYQENLFEAVDVFCETVGFNLEQTNKVFAKAKELNIPIKGHTEQLSNLGGSELVAQYKGLSVDHIEYLDEKAVIALKEAGTVATLLPTAFYFLREIQKPPIELLRKHKVPMAISTDFNPGTAPFTSLRLTMNFACVLFNLTPLEAWQGVTIHAAKALGRENTHGKIAVGYVADLVVWNAKNPVDIIYALGVKLVHKVIYRGKERITKDKE